MATLPDSARELIESGALAHLVTLNRDGSPQVSCVWVGIDGDELVAGHLPEHQKIRNIRRDPRVSVSFEGTRVRPPGLKEYLVIHGTARVTEGGAPELLQRLAHVYLGCLSVCRAGDAIRDGHEWIILGLTKGRRQQRGRS